MVSTFISPVIGKASELGVGLYEDSEPVELFAHSSDAEIDIVIRAVYRQVLGNAHVMESETLPIPESQLRQGDISVREFVRQVALSELYRSRFFDNNSRYRSIELNFKHLLGRAPESYEEMNTHSHILDKGGDEAEINSYLDSDEYLKYFGENIVPYYRGYKTQTGKNIAGFTHIFQILRGSCSSDRSTAIGSHSRLQKSLISNKPSPISSLSTLPSYWKPAASTTNVDEILSQAFTPSQSYSSYQTDRVLQQECDEQKKVIASLEQKLQELQSFATIGAAGLSKWQSYLTNVDSDSKPTASFSNQNQYRRIYAQPGSREALQQLSQQQKDKIASLQQQIAQSQSLANLGEARLNKWRSKVFF